jgi:prephenate dehydrogenase
MSDLSDLRAEIEALDRQLLETLNRRLELVAAVRRHKDATGERWIDPEREAELLQTLVAANGGPLSERGVRAIFAAILDVLKQEVAAERPARTTSEPRATARVVEHLAIVGTGLIGTSIALAARRSGAQCRGFDVDDATLQRAGAFGAFAPVGSLADVVVEAELVVVAVPVGAAAAVVAEVLAAAGPGAVVTDVASTKRALAAIDDPRFVPGHPIAGGATGGPTRAAADLFDAATWFLTPTSASAPESVALVERFVSSLGARPVRTDAAAHDRMLALTSHLPHAIANALMLAAAQDETALAHAGASFREMTRVAGANPPLWSDILIENRDELDMALAAFRAALDALAVAGRDELEASISAAGAARERLDAFAYQTEPAQLNRIRVRVPDRPGVLARITQILGAAQINIEDFELRHVSPEYGGVLVILVAGAGNAARARELLRREGLAAA